MTPFDRDRPLSVNALADNRVARFLDAMLPAYEHHADLKNLEDRHRARISVGLTIIFISVTITMAIFQGLNGTNTGVLISVGLSGVLGAILLAIRRGLPAQGLAHLTVGIVATVSIGTMIASGGESVPAILASCLMPIIALLVLGPPSVAPWTLVCLAGVVLTQIYADNAENYLFSGEILIWHRARMLILSASVLSVSATAFIIGRAHMIATEEARRARRMLLAQDARYRSLVENMGDVLMEFDGTASCRYVSPNCLQVMGRREDEILGHHYGKLVHSADSDGLTNFYRLGKKYPGRSLTHLFRLLHGNGHWLFAQISTRCYVTESGEMRFVSIFRDNTKVRVGELASRHSQRLASVGTLAAGVAHQINNPIGSILNASEFALLSIADDDWEAVERALKANIEQATRCGKIVKNLLHFSANEQPEKTREDLVEIARRARDLTTSYATSNGTMIELICGQEPVYVNLCAIEFEQVLVNLIRNAIEAKPTTNGVEVVISRHRDLAWLEVRDDGCGISKADRNQIFDPFFTTRMLDGGTGLGLSVAHGIVRDHSGTMEIESSEGKGTRVRVELPLAHERAAERANNSRN